MEMQDWIAGKTAIIPSQLIAGNDAIDHGLCKEKVIFVYQMLASAITVNTSFVLTAGNKEDLFIDYLNKSVDEFGKQILDTAVHKDFLNEHFDVDHFNKAFFPPSDTSQALILALTITI